ncbi:anti-sigma factor family protein [Arthrobacter psychrolactophilus]
MSATDPYAQWDGAYVLGALPAAQRRDFEQHFSTCQDCTRRVAELSGLPSLLALTREVPADSPAIATSAKPLYAELSARVTSRRRRLILAAAAAAIALASTTAAITTAVQSSTAPPQSAVSSAASGTELTFTGARATGLTATGELSSFPWGTQISWSCSYSAGSTYGDEQPSQDYALVMVSTSGTETTVASWVAGPGSVVTPTATTATRAHEIARLEIRDATGTVWLSATPQ